MEKYYKNINMKKIKTKLKKFNEIVDNINPDQPLDKEAMGIIMSIMMDKTDKSNEIITSEHVILKEAAQLKVFILRLEILTSLKLTLGALIMIGLYIETFGDAVMYAYYLHRKCTDEILTVENLSMNIFRWGMLTKPQLREMWDAQKTTNEETKGVQQIGYGYDNLLDYALTWEKELVEGASN